MASALAHPGAGTLSSLETQGPWRGLRRLDLTVRARELGGVRGPGEGGDGSQSPSADTLLAL